MTTGRQQTTFYRLGTGVPADVGVAISNAVFASNAEASSIVACARGQSQSVTIHGDGSASKIALPSCYNPTQIVDDDGSESVVFGNLENNANSVWRLTAGGDPEQIVDPVGQIGGAFSCQEIWVFQFGLQATDLWVLDLVTGASTPEFVQWRSGCPVRSPDGSKLAAATVNRTVEVFDLETETVTEVASAGVPWAFSADGSRLLVAGNGTFVVSTDGSGGVEATAQSSNDNRVFCRAGHSGKGLMATAEGIGLFDVNENQFTPLDIGFRMATACFASEDSRWLLADGFLIDVQEAMQVDLHQVDVPSGLRVLDNARRSADSEDRLQSYVWVGRQEHIAAVGIRW